MDNGILITMMPPPEGRESELNERVTTEHLPECRRIPGVRSAHRYQNKEPSPRYMTRYELDHLSVLQTDAHRSIAGDSLSRCSKRILAGFSARWRFEGTLVANNERACKFMERPDDLLLARWIARMEWPIKKIIGEIKTLAVTAASLSRCSFFRALVIKAVSTW